MLDSNLRGDRNQPLSASNAQISMRIKFIMKLGSQYTDRIWTPNLTLLQRTGTVREEIWEYVIFKDFFSMYLTGYGRKNPFGSSQTEAKIPKDNTRFY